MNARRIDWRSGLSRMALAALLCALAAGCGKKGPPLAPIVRIPATADKITVSRVGSDVYVTLAVPVANIDGSIPADLSRIEVYAYTGVAPPNAAQWVQLGTLIGSVPVLPPLTASPPAAPGAAATAPPAGVPQGAVVTLVDRLDASDLVAPPSTLQPTPPLTTQRPAAPVAANAPAVAPLPLRRYYFAVSVGPRGISAPTGVPADFVITPLPEPPAAVRLSYTASEISLTWEPSGGLVGSILDRALPPEAPPRDRLGQPLPAAAGAARPASPTTYNVYRVAAPQAPTSSATSSAWTASTPVPINAVPLTALSASDAAPEFGRERCYAVRAIRDSLIGDLSAPACVTPMDIFPPAVPMSLVALAAEGAVSLLWEPNADPDIRGYLVLRREGGDDTLRQLTPDPIPDARYIDRTAVPGVRYTYTVVAVDTRLPVPNRSAESMPAEETAR